MERLYVVTRQDLPPGAQGAQSQHAVSAFAVQQPDVHREWHQNGKNLVWLAAPDLEALTRLMSALEDQHGFTCAAFFEPDFNDELTAFAVSGEAAKLLSHLPLALRAPRKAA